MKAYQVIMSYISTCSQPMSVRRVDRQPDSRDILINTMEGSHALCGVLRAWLEQDENPARHEARIAYSNFLLETVQEVLAPNASPAQPMRSTCCRLLNCPENRLKQGSSCPSNFLERPSGKLPSSTQRDKILGAIGRLTAPTLKQTIRERARIVAAEIGEAIPDIDHVIEAAVDCRNLFVHGPGDNQARNARIERISRQFIIFLTDTLEFVFAASDLVEAGWDVAKWTEKHKLFGHPFCSYVYSYRNDLAELKKEIGVPDEQDSNSS